MNSSNNSYHVPVMLRECVEGLNLQPGGVYVDATFGGGGHSQEILSKLEAGRLIAFDQDQDARKNAESINQSSFTFCFANFRYLKRYLKVNRVSQVDGILADLGISSHQIDTPERGFSTRFEGDLDMRMDKKSSLTAEEIINTYSESELHKILGMYGEIKNARTLARDIVVQRSRSPISTTGQLLEVLQKSGPKGKIYKYAAQVFQGLRIEVNDEMGALSDFLLQCEEVIKPGGRLVIMSYHSLEDRMVKNIMKTGNLEGKLEKDFYGNIIRPFDPWKSKPVTATQKEIEENPRARSAKLRIGIKNSNG